MQQGRGCGGDDTMGTSVGLVVLLDKEAHAFLCKVLDSK